MALVPSYTENYLYSAHFYVRIMKPEIGYLDFPCQQVTGLEFTSDVIEYREGGNPIPYKAPGAMYNFSNITIRRAQIYQTQSLATDLVNLLSQWIEECKSGLVSKADIEITQIDREGNARKVWYVYGAFPVRYTPGDFDATSNEFIIEEIEFAISDVTFSSVAE